MLASVKRRITRFFGLAGVIFNGKPEIQVAGYHVLMEVGRISKEEDEKKIDKKKLIFNFNLCSRLPIMPRKQTYDNGKNL